MKRRSDGSYRSNAMELPIQITFHQLKRSEAIVENVREHAQKLEKYFDDILSCRVAIEAPHHHHASGNQFRVPINRTFLDCSDSICASFGRIGRRM